MQSLLGTINITKRDSEKGATPQGDAKLENAVYEVFADEDIYNKARTVKYYNKGDLVATRTTNSTGVAESVTELPLGKYIVKEKTPSLGYLIDNTVYTVNLVYANQNTPVITQGVTSNEVVKKQKVHIFKSGIKEQSGEVKGLQGAEFSIKLFADVEKAKSLGYSYEEIWNGIDENGNTVTVNPTRVAQAQVIAPTYSVITTDTEGNAYTIALPFGKYLVKETKTPKDFVTAIDFTFTISQDESEIPDIAKKVKDIFVNNEQMESYIKLVKKDLKTNKTVTLSSATFQIKATADIYDRGTNKILYKKGEAISQKVGSKVYTSFTTNSDNIIVPQDSYSMNDDKGTVITPLVLPVGSYEITEIQIPRGFLQLDSTITFAIENIRSYDTDEYGDYIKEIIIQNEQPTGTLILNKTVNLRDDVDTSLIDVSDLSKIKFRLTATENIIDMADGSIIYNKNEVVGEYNLKTDGTLKVENLPMGAYELQEIETMDGLVSNDTKYEVKFTFKDTITKAYTVDLDIENDTTLFEISKQDITGVDELVGAKLEIRDSENNLIDSWTSTDISHKIEGLTTGKTYTLTEILSPNGYVLATSITFTVENTNETQKITMVDKMVVVSKNSITGDNEVIGAELQVEDLEGNIIDKWTSTDEPHFVNNLIEGETYILIETLAPEGYVISSSIEFTVSYDKETQLIEMIDKQVEVSKKDLTTGEELPGAELQVEDLEGNVIDKWISTDEPHFVNNLIEGETYILKETLAPEGYVISNSIEFTVSYDKENQLIEMIDKQVEISKKDLTTGEELPGAELQVEDLEGNIIDKWISTDKPHFVNNLIEGETYVLIETLAPDYYLLAENIEFTVSYDKENQKIEMMDEPIVIDVDVEKTGYIETQKSNIIQYYFSNIANNSNIYLETFTWIDYLPTDYIRLTEIVTGTWNQDITYSITYRTNLDDKERVLKENLKSTENYKIDCTNIGLADGEYITEYYFNFGRVDIGFKEDIAPSIFCRVLDTVKHKDIFTNKTKTVGTYKTLKDEEKDDWTTVVYEKDLHAKKLPKTGE